MRDRILSVTGVLQIRQSILLDRFHLWRRFGCEEKATAAGYSVVHIEDDMVLRYVFETECREKPDAQRIIVVDKPDIHIPFDIGCSIQIIDLRFSLLFPSLDESALAAMSGLDYDHLAFVANNLGVRKLNKAETYSFCTEELQTYRWQYSYAQYLLDRAASLSESASSHRDWTEIAIYYGKASMCHHSDGKLDGYEENRKRIQQAFQSWVSAKYAMLSGTVDASRPVLLSKVNDFIRKGNKKVALIVMDGMSFENFFTITKTLVKEPLSYDIQSSFSFLPTVTSIARQSVFSGKLPREHTKPFSLENEEKQWEAYWAEHGFRLNEIGFYKDDAPAIPPNKKVVGIIVNICDDLMHDELQGLYGLNQGIENWMQQGTLVALLKDLISAGFSVFITADHGNTSAIAEGRFKKPGVLAEPASRRAVIYQSYAEALELANFSTVRYNGVYLPDDFDAYLFEDSKCYGDKGKEYITHGGMTLEEVVVPFVKIGEYYG